MATQQGICKNCGSLIMLNDKEELCECLFCDCVFPSKEAMEIAKHPEDFTFPNEPQPKREGTKRYNAAPVFPDPIPAAVKRAEVKEEPKVQKSPYEVSPDDIKAPKKALFVICGIAAAAIVLTIAIAWPLYSIRMSNRSALAEVMSEEVFTAFKVNTEDPEQKGSHIGFALRGQQNNELIVATSDKITNEDVLTTFKNYARARAEQYGLNPDDFSATYGGIKLMVYGADGGFELSVQNPEDLTAEAVKALA